MKSKKLKLVILSLLVCFRYSINAQQITKVDLIATGLTCSMCSNAIYKQLKNIPNVDSVNVDLNTNQYSIYFNNTNTIAPSDLKQKVEKAGFFIGSLIIYFKASNLTISDAAQMSNFIFIDTKQQVINGTVQAKVLDKGFVTSKEYKKLLIIYKKYKTYAIGNEKLNHIKIL